MYLEKDNSGFYIIMMFSLVFHVLLLIFLPGIKEREMLKDEEIKKIKAGIVVLKDDTKKQTKAVPKKVAKINEVKKQVTEVKKAPEKIEKKEEPKKEIKKEEVVKEKVIEEIKKFDLSSIKKSSKRELNATSVLSIEKTEIEVSRNTSRDLDLPIETKSENFNENSYVADRKIMDFESKKLEEAVEVTELKNLEIENDKVDLKLLKPVETINDTRTIENSVEEEKYVELGGTDTEISLPKNIVSQLLEGSGTVEWVESNKKPIYPEEAERNAWNGKVSIILIVKNGQTRYSQIDEKSAYPSIDRAVEKVAREWKIIIKSNSGMYVDGKVKITVTFGFE